MRPDRSHFEALLDQEERLRDLHDMVVAIDLVAAGSLGQGIGSDDMPGLKALSGRTRDLAEGARRAWREVIARFQDDR